MDVFEFKKHLYRVANGLSIADVKNLKFICEAGYIQRRLAERIKTGFHLLCVLAERNHISPQKLELLEFLLGEVHKTHLLDPLRAVEGRGLPAPNPAAQTDNLNYDTEKLERQLQSLLRELGDRLPDKDFRNLALFFFDESFSLQDIEQLDSPGALFQSLRDRGIIDLTDLQKLQVVLEIIGRKDLCQLVQDYIVKTKNYIISGHTSHGLPPMASSQRHGGEEIISPVEEERGLPPTTVTPTFARGHSTISSVSSISSQFSTGSSLESPSWNGSLSPRTGFTDATSQPTSGPPSSLQSSAPYPISAQSSNPSMSEKVVVHNMFSTSKRVISQPQDSSANVADMDGGHQCVGGVAASGVQESEQQSGSSAAMYLQGTMTQAVEMNSDITVREKEIEDLREQQKSAQVEMEKRKEIEGILKVKLKEFEQLRMERNRLKEELLKPTDDEALYEMSSRPHGIALVIMNDHFASCSSDRTLDPRKGGSRDQMLFRQMFEHLGYDVHLRSNLKADEMREEMERIAKIDHSNYDSFVCCISTHGKEDIMYGSDSRGVPLTEFGRPLKMCHSLLGKPKMFFIQACRVVCPPNRVKADCATTQPEADLLVAWATTFGQRAYIVPEQGSWFVNALFHVFTQKATHSSLIPMMLEVNQVVCNRQGKLEIGTGTWEEVAQCAEIKTTFRKGVRF